MKDFEHTLERIWGYVQRNEMEEALEQIQKLEQADIQTYRQKAAACANPQEALGHLERAIALMESADLYDVGIVEEKIQRLCQMGQWEEALDVVDLLMNRHGYENGFQMKFEICCQAASWAQAQQVLDLWKQERHKDPARKHAQTKLKQLMGQSGNPILNPKNVEAVRLKLQNILKKQET